VGANDDNLATDTHERMGSLMTAQASARELQGRSSASSEPGEERAVRLEDAERIIADWPQAPRKVAEKLLDHYGPPNEATATKFFWYRTGPWARMELTADEVLHNFPTPHTDFLTQYVDYPIDATRANELLTFDGSVLIDRTAGQIGARCDHEAYNTLTINLAVEIMEGRRTVAEARDLYGDTAAAFVMGRDAPYAERLLFTPPGEETADPDEAIIGSHVVDQIKEKFKDLVGGGDAPQ
jgi:hypothetical protein